MKKLLLLFLVAVSLSATAQFKLKGNEGGVLSLGVRSTASTFSDAGANGAGFGGHFRLRAGKKLNTEWFADFINNDIQGLAKRTDAHIGWSVMFYPFNAPVEKGKLVPYIVAGHCFDYTRLKEIDKPEKGLTGSTVERWSSAVQGGLGLHYLVTERIDLSLTSQYMSHLGNDIHADVHKHGDINEIHFSHSHGGSLEGHLLFTLSVNFHLVDLW
jgi:opacity protein-like surface antigen